MKNNRVFKSQHYFLYDSNKQPRGCVLLTKLDDGRYLRTVSLRNPKDRFTKERALEICKGRVGLKGTSLFKYEFMGLHKSFYERKKNDMFTKSGLKISEDIIKYKYCHSDYVPLNKFEKSIVAV